MDYEVFLLSRIRERYLATGDNRRAVAEGLQARTLGGRGVIRVEARGRRLATAPGVAQVVGRPLGVGERLRLSGLPSGRGSLTLMLRDRKRRAVVRFARLQRGRSATVTVLRRGRRITARVQYRNGRSQPPTSLRHSPARGK
jgi:hypothetical protein